MEIILVVDLTIVFTFRKKNLQRLKTLTQRKMMKLRRFKHYR